MSKLIVIGAGAAGMMAAIQAAKSGADVTIVEKNNRPGRKIMIAGKGRCNVTNSADLTGFLKNVPGNGHFLYSALSRFSNRDLIAFFEERGVPLKTERGGRVFPVSDTASDIVSVLKRELNKNKVKIIYGRPVAAILIKNGKASGVRTKDADFIADSVVLATGGASYPATGSTGDGYKMAVKVGHTVVKPKPALVPLEVAENCFKNLTGLSLINVETKLEYNGKAVESEFGEMLFTHFGVSGPIILTLSRIAVELLQKGGRVGLSIDLKPALDFEQLDRRLIRDFEKFSTKIFKNSLVELLPKALIPIIIRLSGIKEDKPVNKITRGERKVIVDLIKGLKMTVTKARPIEEAIVTAGGVSTKEINPKTMESKIISGLYFAGEVIDVDANTGGFNLQIAFSTGYVAGEEAAKRIQV